jgi:uncharacterized protein (DUF1684 family)
VRNHRPAFWLVLVASCLACAPEESGLVQTAFPSGPGVPADQLETWISDLIAERAEKDEEFATSETSPMAGTQYLKSEPSELVFLTREGNTFELAYEESPGAVLSAARLDGAWHWEARADEVVCWRGEEMISSGQPIEGPALFSLGGLRLSFYPSQDRVTFIVFDREREEMKAFEHLLYYAPDPAFAVQAELVPFEDPTAFEVPTSRDLKKTFYRFATIRFVIDGKEQVLTALKSALDGEGSEGLFVPFRDATSGYETYGAGRFLEIDDPEGEFFVLDFNRVFNPLCNYSPAYNCALPPAENRLEVAIRAGEKTYPH